MKFRDFLFETKYETQFNKIESNLDKLSKGINKLEDKIMMSGYGNGGVYVSFNADLNSEDAYEVKKIAKEIISRIEKLTKLKHSNSDLTGWGGEITFK